MTSRSRLVKREQDVDEDEEDVDTFTFDNEDSTNLEDPLAINDDDLDISKADMKTGIVKEEVDDEEGGRRLRSHSNENAGIPCKVIILVKAKPKRVGHRNGGRRRKYATREEKLKAKAEQKRQRRAKMKEEEREEILRKQRERSRRRMTEMKEEARKLKNEMAENYSNDSGREQVLAEDSQSQPNQQLTRYEELLKRQREYARRQREENPEKYKEKLRKQRERKKRLKEENPEKYRQNRTKGTERARKQRQASEIKKPRKQLTEEQKERKKMLARLRAQKDRERIRFANYSRLQMKIAQMTDEELEALKAKRREYAKKFYDKLSGEKLEKYRTLWRNQMKKYHEKRLATMGEAYKEVVNARYRNYVANETPEQRQRRLRRYKINQAITKLRKQLEEIDVPPEEVERRVTELKKTMEAEPLPPPETLSKYKPRVKTEVNFSFPPRSNEGRRRGRPPGSSRKVVVSKTDDSSDSLSQPGRGSIEMDDSNDYDDQHHGFQWDSTVDDGVHEQDKTDPNHETTTIDPEPIPILRFDIKCPHCPSTYSERSDLISHIGSEHSEICWKCPKCKLIVLSSDELSEHYKSEHLPISKRSTEASTCNSASMETETLSKATEGNTFTCIKCDPVKSPRFESLKDLMAHVKSTHPNSFWPCSKCNLLKYSESALKIHEKVCKRLGRRTVKKRSVRKGVLKK